MKELLSHLHKVCKVVPDGEIDCFAINEASFNSYERKLLLLRGQWLINSFMMDSQINQSIDFYMIGTSVRDCYYTIKPLINHIRWKGQNVLSIDSQRRYFVLHHRLEPCP